MKGLPGSHKLKDALTKMETFDEMNQILDLYMAEMNCKAVKE